MRIIIRAAAVVLSSLLCFSPGAYAGRDPAGEKGGKDKSGGGDHSGHDKREGKEAGGPDKPDKGDGNGGKK